MAKIREDLVGSVLVENPAGGDPIVLVAGSKVPEGVVVGDHVLKPKGEKSEPTAPEAPETASSDASDDGGSGEPSGEDGANTSGLAVPPLHGAGSGADAWRAYAAAAATAAGLQIEIPADAKRGDIVEALKGAGIPVE